MLARLLPLALPALLAACSGPREPQVADAWVRLAAVPGRPAAAYFTLKGGAADATLVRVRAAGAIRTELHESMAGAGGMMRMEAIPAVPLPAGGEVRFAPGGRHAMLFDVNPAVRPGGTTRLDFALADGRTLSAEAKVVAAGDAAP